MRYNKYLKQIVRRRERKHLTDEKPREEKNVGGILFARPLYILAIMKFPSPSPAPAR